MRSFMVIYLTCAIFAAGQTQDEKLQYGTNPGGPRIPVHDPYHNNKGTYEDKYSYGIKLVGPRIPVHEPYHNNKDSEEIIRILNRDSLVLRDISHKVHDIDGSLKSIKQDSKQQQKQLDRIEGLEIILTNIQIETERNSHVIVEEVQNLTAAITIYQNNTENHLKNLQKDQQDIKQTLLKVDANQNKYQSEVNEVTTGIQEHLINLEKLQQSVVEHLKQLEISAHKSQETQKKIEENTAQLEELNALSKITSYKVIQLEEGVRTLNRNQEQRLNNISEAAHGIQQNSKQIDNKLGLLLGSQKNIEKALDVCTRRQPHYHGHNPRINYNVVEKIQEPAGYSKPGYISAYE